MAKSNNSDLADRVIGRLKAESPERGPKTYYLRKDLVERLEQFATTHQKKPSAVVEAILLEFLDAAGKGNNR